MCISSVLHTLLPSFHEQSKVHASRERLTCAGLAIYRASYLCYIPCIKNKLICYSLCCLFIVKVKSIVAMGGRTIAAWVPVTATLAFVLMVYLQGVGGATFTIQNECSFTVWAAGIPVGGGQALAQGQTWSVEVPAGTSAGRFWGRTGCSFDASGQGSCTTGDCSGVLNCTVSGQPPATLAEYTLNGSNNLDTYDISLVDGFNLPLSITPSNSSCPTVDCSSNVTANCPTQLQVAEGCNSACSALNTPQYCCTGDYLNNCPPTSYSEYFKGQCPQAYSYAKDDNTSTFTCPSGANYNIAFCT